MPIAAGDVYQVYVRREDPDTGETRAEPLEGHYRKVLAVDGEQVRYQRAGAEPSDTTRAILQASIDRGDLVRVDEPPPGLFD